MARKGTYALPLRRARKNAQLDQRTVAARIGVAQQSVSKWETGKSEPDLDTFRRLMDLYHMSADDFLGIRRPDPAPAGHITERYLQLVPDLDEYPDFRQTEPFGMVA